VSVGHGPVCIKLPLLAVAQPCPRLACFSYFPENSAAALECGCLMAAGTPMRPTDLVVRDIKNVKVFIPHTLSRITAMLNNTPHCEFDWYQNIFS
jgi:hypothetical protein